MPAKYPPEAIEYCFGLYLKYNGANFDRIEQEMQAVYPGWSRTILFNRGLGENFRTGWIEKYGWEAALKIHLSVRGKNLLSSGEKLLAEVETIRERLFEQILASGVANRDLVYQHDKYSQRSAELLDQLSRERNTGIDFARFWTFLMKNSVSISPALARELASAEDAMFKKAKDEFSPK